VKRIFFCIVIFLFISNSPVLGMESIEFLSGYLKAPLKDKEDYEALPIYVSFNFDVKPLIENFGVGFKGNLHLSVEPFITPTIAPDANIELGVNFLAKYIFPLGGKIKPYIKGGLGFLYMSQHTREQSTQYNFLPQVGVGCSYFINEEKALSFEYRYRHLSNASFKSPNSGIDSTIYLVGMVFFF